MHKHVNQHKKSGYLVQFQAKWHGFACEFLRTKLIAAYKCQLKEMDKGRVEIDSRVEREIMIGSTAGRRREAKEGKEG